VNNFHIFDSEQIVVYQPDWYLVNTFVSIGTDKKTCVLVLMEIA